MQLFHVTDIYTILNNIVACYTSNISISQLVYYSFIQRNFYHANYNPWASPKTRMDHSSYHFQIIKSEDDAKI